MMEWKGVIGRKVTSVVEKRLTLRLVWKVDAKLKYSRITIGGS